MTHWNRAARLLPFVYAATQKARRQDSVVGCHFSQCWKSTLGGWVLVTSAKPLGLIAGIEVAVHIAERTCTLVGCFELSLVCISRLRLLLHA
jgi:hypothetical protein